VKCFVTLFPFLEFVTTFRISLCRILCSGIDVVLFVLLHQVIDIVQNSPSSPGDLLVQLKVELCPERIFECDLLRGLADNRNFLAALNRRLELDPISNFDTHVFPDFFGKINDGVILVELRNLRCQHCS
jgi:hypothetical protein